jgi:hypothetical protein
MCGAYEGALLIDAPLTSHIISLLKKVHWYPEMYREPPPRRTRVVCADILCGQFGNSSVIPPLGMSAKCEGIPINR